jgi:hypothetical protein
MSGAPITFTLYKNGIHITYGDPEFVHDAEIEAQMRAAFDAGTDAAPFDSPLGDLIRVAVDCLWAEDKRGEVYAGTPVSLKHALAIHKKR